MLSALNEKGNAIGSVGIFLLASLLYLYGLCPTISWFDSPEFVTVPYTLGISHPAGSPTYSLAVKLATFLPLGSVALRVNAASALASALTLVLVFRLLWWLLSGPANLAAVSIRSLAAWSGVLFLLVSESFWRLAEVAEVYSLQNWYFALLLLLLVKARSSPPQLQQRYWWAFAFCYGLSAGVHAAMAFFLPAFILFLAFSMPRAFRSRALAFLGFFFLLGFATYLYLPLRSLTEPAFNWGEPQTWRQFWTHITDQKDSAVVTDVFWQQLPYQLSMYFTHLVNEFSPFGVILGALGFVRCWRRDKPLWVLLSFAWFGYTLFFVRSWWDTAWGFIPSFVVFALWIGLGVATCLQALYNVYQRHTIRVPRVAFLTFFLSALGLTVSQELVRHAPITNQADNYAAELYGKVLIEQLPPDAILFCQYAWFPLLYLQAIERQRPDLTFILQGEVFSPRYFSLISPKRFPNIQQVTSDQPVAVSTAQYFWMFSKLNAPQHPLFWDPDSQYQAEFPTSLLPQGLLFAFDPINAPERTPEALRRHEKLVSQATNRILQGKLEDFTTYFLANKLSIIAAYFRQIGDAPQAYKTFYNALAIRPDEKLVNNNYGAFLMAQGHPDQALEYFNRVYEQDPIGPIINRNLGLFLARKGDMVQAASFFQRSLNFGGANGDTYEKLAEVYVALKRVPSAVETLRLALQYYQQRLAKHAANTQLQNKIALIEERIQQLENQGQAGPQPK
jgi:Tfp pilus assembly protein PilF